MPHGLKEMNEYHKKNMRFVFLLLLSSSLCGVMATDTDRLEGNEFLEGIRSIIGADPNMPQDQVFYKPLSGSFSTIHDDNDPLLHETSYCLTDNHCGHWEAYGSNNVPLSDLSCNKFCYIDRNTWKYRESVVHNVNNPPSSYLNCGWETCG